LPTHAAITRRTQPATDELVEEDVRDRPDEGEVASGRCRISSWPAANGMSASSAAPMQIEAPSGAKRADGLPAWT